MSAHGTIQIAGKGSVKVQFPSGMTLQTITVTTPPGVSGSNTQQSETVVWSQKLTRTGHRLRSRKVWIVTITWDVVTPRELTYLTS